MKRVMTKTRYVLSPKSRLCKWSMCLPFQVEALSRSEFTKSVLRWDTELSLKDWMSAVDLCFVDPLDPRGRMPDAEERKKAALMADGERTPVTVYNVQKYVNSLCQRWLASGVRPQMVAFRKGVSDFFSFNSLLYFSPSEMVTAFVLCCREG